MLQSTTGALVSASSCPTCTGTPKRPWPTSASPWPWPATAEPGPLAQAVPTPARPASSQRCLERLLANERLQPPPVQQALARELTAFWQGRKLLLLLDETPKA